MCKYCATIPLGRSSVAANKARVSASGIDFVRSYVQEGVYSYNPRYGITVRGESAVMNEPLHSLIEISEMKYINNQTRHGSIIEDSI